MQINKVRFIEPGNLPYHRSVENLYTYDKYIRNPSIGLLTLATIVKEIINDTYMYSESISKIRKDDVMDADIIFISIFTFNAVRGYKMAQYFMKNTNAIVVMGGLHASLNYTEAVKYCHYVMLGEGDESIVEFINAVKMDKPIDFPGVAYRKNGYVVCTGDRQPPENINTIPDRNLLYRYKKMSGHNTLWPQVHASRGCPYNCDYCSVVRHFGRHVRTRSPENVLEDIRQSIDFHEKGNLRIAKILWLTDDNFFADRDWAISVLKAIINSDIKYKFTIQARYEVGFDDEMLALLKKAGFIELAIGIEFLEDEAFEKYHKKSTYSEILHSIKNIQKNGLSVRGLFILGADNHTKGVGERLADFVIKNDIKGVLIQSMYFVPGTPVYDANKNNLLHKNWAKYNGNVVHYPKNISPYDLQLENIHANAKIYSVKRLIEAILHEDWTHKILFIGEFFWQKSVRDELIRELPYLRIMSKNKAAENKKIL